jgi:2-dehydropantoate 2-reductase
VLLGIVGAVASSQGNANPDDVQAARDKFAYPALQKQVYDVGALTARNSSSMRQDVVAGRKTEIEYINGFVGRAAEALELECPVNARVVGMVREGVVGVREEDIGERFGVS